MITIIIYKDGQVQQKYEHETSDIKALGYMLRNQPNSTDHAIRYEGWSVELIDEDTKESEFWKPYSKIHN